MNASKVLILLWGAITIPVVGVGTFLYVNLKQPSPVIVTKTVVEKIVVTPTATPSATIVPVRSSSIKAVNVTVKPVTPTVKGGAK
jgi:hypothetical protein